MNERVGVLVVGAGIVSVVAVYLALNATSSRDTAKDLLPYQTLAVHCRRRINNCSERFARVCWPPKWIACARRHGRNLLLWRSAA
jgi:hypothetical protein